MINKLIANIVILGGGSAGWMAAAALSNALENNCRITLVESEEIATVGVGEATIPPIKLFNRQLGIGEAEFLRQTQGTFKLGIEFKGWKRAGASYFHPFGPFGADFDFISLHQYWLKESLAGNAGGLCDYSMAWQLAKQNKFEHPVRDKRLVQSTFDYAYHFDAGLYARFLRNYAEQRGVTRIEGKVKEVQLEANRGFIQSLLMTDGSVVNGEFFIDCSGFSSILARKTLGVIYESWSQWLPCDRAWAVPSQLDGEIKPYTKSTASSAGWRWRIPLQSRQGNGHVYCSSFLDDQAALDLLIENLDTPAIADPKLISFETGRLVSSWTKNCVALGLAGGFLEPLESTSLHLIQTGITRLLALFPDQSMDPLLAQEFNRITKLEYEAIRDFLILHYCVNSRHGEAFWDRCREMPIPDTLAYKIEHFKRYGRLVAQGFELFQNPSWLAVMIGQGILPEQCEPLVYARSSVAAPGKLAGLLEVMKSVADQAAPHSQYLKSYCLG